MVSTFNTQKIISLLCDESKIAGKELSAVHVAGLNVTHRLSYPMTQPFSLKLMHSDLKNHS